MPGGLPDRDSFVRLTDRRVMGAQHAVERSRHGAAVVARTHLLSFDDRQRCRGIEPSGDDGLRTRCIERAHAWVNTSDSGGDQDRKTSPRR